MGFLGGRVAGPCVDTSGEEVGLVVGIFEEGLLTGIVVGADVSIIRSLVGARVVCCAAGLVASLVGKLFDGDRVVGKAVEGGAVSSEVGTIVGDRGAMDEGVVIDRDGAVGLSVTGGSVGVVLCRFE